MSPRDQATETPEQQHAEELVRRFVEVDEQPIDPEVGRRVRRRVAERLAAPARAGRHLWARRAKVAALAAVGTAAGIVWTLHPRSEAPRVAEGAVVVESGATEAVLREGEAIQEGARVASRDQEAVLAIGRARVVMKPHSLCVIAPGRIALDHGAVLVDVEPRPGAASFAVTTAEAVVEVVGTSFSVSCSPDTGTVVRVSRGAVHIQAGDDSLTVAAGMSWQSRPTSAAPQTPFAAPPRRAALEPQPNPLHAAAQPASGLADELRLLSEHESDPTLATARQLLEAGDTEGALALYRSIGDGEGPAAEVALYIVARLEATVRNQPGLALAALAKMRVRFPKGELALERALSEIEAFQRLGWCEEAAEAAAELAVTRPEALAPLQRRLPAGDNCP